MAKHTARFKTSGMHCSSCSMLIEMDVGELDGVAEVSADHATGLTVVTFDDERISEDSIAQTIRAAGYEVEPGA
jgi:copper chaperone CopZ